MINDIKMSITDKLNELYSTYKVYDEYVPSEVNAPYFIISVTNQEYKKRINQKYKSHLSFDVAFFSSESKEKIKTDCLNMQINLFRAFDLVGGYRILNKQAKITDDVLHFTFDIKYSEMVQETGTKMQSQITNKNL
ncbi:phage tail terminator family protein [Anaerovorax odorimutans]|uniref:phage tail terminator family protein n=1 Tax=Anaerovorax odorimutans TaxID=109327 RepID=UPI0004063698|nr:hypothetical protein [Anaerovorax odorimutans]